METYFEQYYKNKVTNKETNQKQETQNRFHFKAFMNKLLTLQEKHNHYPSIYDNDIYPECNSLSETNTHLFTCPIRKKTTLENINNAIIKALLSFLSFQEATNLLEKFIKLSNFLKIDPIRSTQP